MTAPLGSVAQLVSVIRRQLAAPPARPAGAASASARGAAGQRAAPDRAAAEEQLGQLIELRVRHIARDDPQRGRKAFRVFLEAVLAAHFGPGLLNDAGFHQMVEDVQQAMEGNADCRRLIDSAIEQLLKREP